MFPLLLGTMAMFEVIAPSSAFSVEMSGCVSPAGTGSGTLAVPVVPPSGSAHNPCAVDEGAHVFVSTFTPLKAVGRVSITRQGVTV